MKQIARFSALSPDDRCLLVEAGLLVIAIRLGLWLLPFRTLRHILAGATRTSAEGVQVGQPFVERVAWAVTVTSCYTPAATCLTQALAAQALLKRRNCTSYLRIGVATDELGQLHAHAWLESQGRVVIGAAGHDLGSYTVLPALELDRP